MKTDSHINSQGIITSCKSFQIIRVSQIRSESRKGEARKLYCQEVVQRWISPDGKVTDMALLRGFTFHYCDCWSYWSDMEIRPHNSLYDDVVVWSDVYPRMSVIPQLKRNGFKGDFHGISPFRLFKALLADPKIETMMKAGEIEEMKYFLTNPRNADELWVISHETDPIIPRGIAKRTPVTTIASICV